MSRRCNSVRLHPDYPHNLLRQFGQQSRLQKALAVVTLGGSMQAQQHWDISAWTGSKRHKGMACLENIPLVGGMIAMLERLSLQMLWKDPLDQSDEILQGYFHYMKKTADRKMLRAKKTSELSVKCSLIDHFSFPLPVYTVFFYPKHIDQQRIVDAIERTLDDFPLFAGRLRKTEGHLYIDCNNEGVELTSVYSEGRLSEFLSKYPDLKATAFVNEINPYATLKERWPLLKIKLSYFSEGLAIGYSWHHSVGDMSTFMQFLNAVSLAAKAEKIPHPIVFTDREKDLESSNPDAPSQSANLKLLSVADIFQLVKQHSFPAETVYLYFSNEELEALRQACSEGGGHKLSRNDALCGHLLEAVATAREDDSDTQCASIAINARKRLKLDPNTPGNILGIATIQLPKHSSAADFATAIHENVSQYSIDFNMTEKFVQEHGGIEKVQWMIPIQFLPKYRNIIFTSWANFGVYSIDFGVATPDLFLPVGEVPLPWAARIVEGFQNQGRLVALTLPSKVAAGIKQPEMLAKIHRYRPQGQTEAVWDWVK